VNFNGFSFSAGGAFKIFWYKEKAGLTLRREGFKSFGGSEEGSSWSNVKQRNLKVKS